MLSATEERQQGWTSAEARTGLFGAAVLLGLGALFGIAYFLFPSFREGLGRAVSVIASGDVHRIRDYFLAFGPWAPAVSAGLTLLSVIIAPLPGFGITIANGLLFGLFWGTVLSVAANVVSGAVTYWVTHALGRPVVERFVSRKVLDPADRVLKRYGNRAVFIARLIPLISFDVVGYAAGLGNLPFWGYILATAAGTVPGTAIYVMLGHNLSRGTWFILFSIGLLIATAALGLFLRWYLEKRFLAKKGTGL